MPYAQISSFRYKGKQMKNYQGKKKRRLPGKISKSKNMNDQSIHSSIPYDKAMGKK